MDNIVFIFFAGLAGLAIGLLISWPLARAKISATELKAKSDVATELAQLHEQVKQIAICLLYTSPSPRDRQKSRMPSSA